jgi:hypothetical protein
MVSEPRVDLPATDRREPKDGAGLCHRPPSLMSLPPGLLDGLDSQIQYVETSSGGDQGWLTITSKKLYTNAFIVLPGSPRKVVTYEQLETFAYLHSQILLGYKKRGFGAHLSVTGLLCNALATYLNPSRIDITVLVVK